MFWETGRDVRGKLALFKYNWIEKSVVAAAVTIAFLSGEAPPRLMISVVLTNWLWIPVILYYDLSVRRLGQEAATTGTAPARATTSGGDTRDQLDCRTLGPRNRTSRASPATAARSPALVPHRHFGSDAVCVVTSYLARGAAGFAYLIVGPA